MGKMQDKPLQYYQKFHCVICGLDSVPARRWINSTCVVALVWGPLLLAHGNAFSRLVNAVVKDENGELDLDTLIPMIDAGRAPLTQQQRHTQLTAVLQALRASRGTPASSSRASRRAWSARSSCSRPPRRCCADARF